MGRYRLGALLGRGATSSVRRASDARGGADVAVKTVPADPDLLARVGVEIRAAQRLDHPNVVRLLDWGEGDECVHLVWELVDGPSLREALPEGGAADGWCFARMAEVMEALAHAHSRGVVHRDVKPANVLLDPRGRARLTDFGVARLVDERGLTRVGSMVGTVAYMAPEQARAEAVSPATDVYAASLVLYEMLTGRNPLNHRSPAEAARRAAAAEIPPLAGLRPDLPGRAVAIVERGLQPDPSRRPSAADMARAMREASVRLTPAARRGVAARRLAPVLAPAALWALLAGLAVHAWSAAGPLETMAAAVAAGGAAARWPRVSAAVTVAAAALMLGGTSAGAGLLLGAGGILMLLTGLRWPRLLGVPALAPIAASVGLLPLALAGVAALRTWPQRIWAASCGIGLTVAWQLWAGGSRVLLGPNPPRAGAVALDGEDNLFRVADVLTADLGPWVAWQGAALLAGALAAVLIARAPAGPPAAVVAGAWSAALLVAGAAASPAPAEAVGAVLPGALLVVLWAWRPWRTLGRLGGEPASATLREPV
ncbi:MAG: serine/threonine protein kinase [Thermoleophilia bacterium]|nr:serine/threonine protein kinase [Thermoleophilia bacterium]